MVIMYEASDIGRQKHVKLLNQYATLKKKSSGIKFWADSRANFSLM